MGGGGVLKQSRGQGVIFLLPMVEEGHWSILHFTEKIVNGKIVKGGEKCNQPEYEIISR